MEVVVTTGTIRRAKLQSYRHHQHTVISVCIILQRHSWLPSFNCCILSCRTNWPVKVELELKMNCTEMSMIRWMCGVKLNERKKSEELRELLGLEPVSLMIKKNRLRWFGLVEQKDDNDWVKHITWEVEGMVY